MTCILEVHSGQPALAFLFSTTENGAVVEYEVQKLSRVGSSCVFILLLGLSDHHLSARPCADKSIVMARKIAEWENYFNCHV